MTSRLDKARDEYRAALEEERDRLDAELSTLLDKVPAAPVPAPPVRRRPKPKPKPKPKLKPKLKQHPRTMHIVRPSRKTAKKVGTETCGECGRSELFKAMGKGVKGLLKFHYCPKGVPCAGSSLSSASAEDLKAGKHTKSACPKCIARVVFK